MDPISKVREGLDLSKRMRVAAGMLIVVGSLVMGAGAEAAPPPNDEFSGATVIPELPFVDVVDTTDADATPDETELNSFCGATVMEHAVWYTFTASTEGAIIVDVSASDYAAGIVVVVSEAGELVPINCQPGIVTAQFVAGQTLYFMVFGDGNSEKTSGTLKLQARPPVPPPKVELTVNRVGGVDEQGAVTITGTVTCTTPDGNGEVLSVEGFIRQRVGRGSVFGIFFSGLSVPCDGTAAKWSGFSGTPLQGTKFAGGKADVLISASACGTDECSGATLETTIQLTNGRFN
jgi:hypothetical protein